MRRHRHKRELSAIAEVMTDARLAREAAAWLRCGFSRDELKIVDYPVYGPQVRPLMADELKVYQEARPWR